MEVRLYSIRENVKKHKLVITLKKVNLIFVGNQREHFSERSFSSAD